MYLDYKEHKAGVYVIDIETDDLNAKVLHVMCWRNILTQETGECIGIKETQEFFTETVGSIYIGHNILKFDGPTLNRLAGTALSARNCIDTLVLSTLYSPSLEGGHSLDAWGERLSKPKIEFADFGRCTPKMIEYCHQDVLITAELFVRLIRVLAKVEFSERSIWLQHRLTVLMEKQRKTGFKFDGQRAIGLYQQLRKLESDLTDEIRERFPAKRVLVATRQAYKKSGEHSRIYELDRDRYEIRWVQDEHGRYEAYESIPFNIGSPLQRIERLLELGWEPYPDEHTPKTEKGGGGNPTPFIKGKMAPSLEKFFDENDVPEIAMIAKWMAFNGRANMINTWLENWNEDDECIHGKLFTADTLRFRHQAPNTANIPAVRSNKAGEVLYGEEGFFTYEARDLWVARPGRVLVGTDASGLELRMLAHYLNRPDFTKQVVEGDPHQYNADVVGITRPQAKTLIYAIMYGAAAPKIAATLNVPVKEGAKIRNMFLDRLGLKELIEECQYEQKNGRVSLCDGSQVVCPSPHAALNYKLQGGGARVMGMGAILLETQIARLDLDSLKVGDIHDEWQYDVLPDNAEAHVSASIQAIRDAGERLGLNVPLDADAKIGRTWAETH